MVDFQNERSSRVYVDPTVKRTDVELPPGFFESTGVRPGQPILVKGRDVGVRLRALENTALRDFEVVMSPMLALFLGIRHAVPLEGRELSAIREGLSTELARFTDTLEESFEGLPEEGPEDGRAYQGIDISSTIEGLVVDVGHHERDHLEVGPNPDGIGIPRGEVCEDASLHVKEWTPLDKDGHVRIFRPGGEPKEDDGD